MTADEPFRDESFRIHRQASPIRSQVAELLREAIRQERFKPGQRLVERELIELTGVSRASIREAMRELATEGLVHSIPNKGIVVSGLTVREAEEFYEVRSALEGLAARRFVEQATDQQIAELEHAYALIKLAAERGQNLLAVKDEFYAVLFAGAGNNLLQTVVTGFHSRIRALRSLTLSSPNRVPQTVAEIGRIVKAVQDRDADLAAMACSFHVQQAGRVAVAALRARNAADPVPDLVS